MTSWRRGLAALDDLLRAYPRFERWLDIAEVGRQAAETAGAEHHIYPSAAAEQRAKPAGQVSLHGLHLRVEFPYDPELVQGIKAQHTVRLPGLAQQFGCRTNTRRAHGGG